MSFKSKAQARAAFGGYLGPKMKSKAKEFADATPSIKALPMHVDSSKPMKSLKDHMDGMEKKMGLSGYKKDHNGHRTKKINGGHFD